MHEAEKTLTRKQWDTYAEWLGWDDDEFSAKQLPRIIHVTATQRAEAFLRTVGKWKEGA